MPASSQASSELSTASLTAVRRAFLGLSKPSRCLFLAKNSLTDMSRCFAAIDSAVAARRFGCSPVSLAFGIFVCSSILPECTLVFITDRSGPDVDLPAARNCFPPSGLKWWANAGAHDRVNKESRHLELRDLRLR